MPQQPGETFDHYSARVKGKTQEIITRNKQGNPVTSEQEAYQKKLAAAKDRYRELVRFPYRPARFLDKKDSLGKIMLSELEQIERALLDPEAEQAALREIDIQDNKNELNLRKSN